MVYADDIWWSYNEADLDRDLNKIKLLIPYPKKIDIVTIGDSYQSRFKWLKYSGSMVLANGELSRSCKLLDE